MYTQIAEHAIAFDGNRCITKGDILSVAQKVKALVDRKPEASILIFDAITSRIVEIDFRGSADDVLDSLRARLREAGTESEQTAVEHRGPGRPKLGVVSREVTLLPRHWEWLEQQPGGASVTLRKLVEAARKTNSDRDRRRLAQESAYRFMNAMAGDLRGYEEALRALYAGDTVRFSEEISSWPVGIREHAQTLGHRVFEPMTDEI